MFCEPFLIMTLSFGMDRNLSGFSEFLFEFLLSFSNSCRVLLYERNRLDLQD